VPARRLLSLGALALTLLGAAPAAATPPIQAHRGGPIADGVPAYAENTLPAFRRAARDGFVLELDVKLTKDRVPVVFHDAGLERVTGCTGLVRDRTLEELRDCPVVWLGRRDPALPHVPAPSPVPIPTLAEVLRLADRHRARVNAEIKNQPTDPDFDPGDGFPRAVVDAIVEAGFPPSRLVIQSFWPTNLTFAKARLPGAETSLLSLAATNPAAPAVAAAAGHEWVSPEGVPEGALVSAAHALGRRVVPYTMNTPEEVRGAVAAGVDELISDDPEMARKAVASVAPPRPAEPPPPDGETCERLRASRTLPTIQAYDPEPRAPRVFAMQFKQDLRHVVSYEAFRAKIECLVRDVVVPRKARGRPNVVAFNEDIGLMTIATGSRGAGARALYADPASAPSCEPQGLPCGAIAALGTILTGYAPQVAAYAAAFPGGVQPVSSAFLAATDTFARGWMQTFSDIAKRYGVYILGSNNQAPFRESTDPAEIDRFRDPDLPRPGSVFVATSARVYNEVFLWGPRDVRTEGPLPLRNVVASNRKVPLTSIEEQFQLTPGASTGPDAIENLRPYALPGTDARIGFATSLPAFRYGSPAGDPCADVRTTYMRCLDALGTNLVMQDEANPGPWGADSGCGGTCWQPLDWMTSTWRAVADPTVSFAYNVTPHMVGNLADLTFDGQTAITQRGLRDRGCSYVGNAFTPGDPEHLRGEAGPKHEFLAIVPWVRPDGPREELRATAAKLSSGSGDPLAGDYVESAIAADLPFPPDGRRGSCLTEADTSKPRARLLRPRVRGRTARIRLRARDRGSSGIAHTRLTARRLPGGRARRVRARRLRGRPGAAYRVTLRVTDRAGNAATVRRRIRMPR
jgi:glycerophosphoryl diester phosphodiesterase